MELRQPGNNHFALDLRCSCLHSLGQAARARHIGLLGGEAQARGQIRDCDRAAVGVNHRLAEAVFELAHIAGPGIVFERGNRLRTDAFNPQLQLCVCFADQVMRQGEDVFAALA